MTTERTLIAQARKQWATPTIESQQHRRTLTAVALGMVAGLLAGLGILFINGYFGAPVRVAPSPMVITTDRYVCTTVWLDGRWQWPPICGPVTP